MTPHLHCGDRGFEPHQGHIFYVDKIKGNYFRNCFIHKTIGNNKEQLELLQLLLCITDVVK